MTKVGVGTRVQVGVSSIDSSVGVAVANGTVDVVLFSGTVFVATNSGFSASMETGDSVITPHPLNKRQSTANDKIHLLVFILFPAFSCYAHRPVLT